MTSSPTRDDEDAPLIEQDASPNVDEQHGIRRDDSNVWASSYGAGAGTGEGHGMPSTITRHLYISHFLSTWNSRVFEFGSVLYLAKIFPGNLLPMSVYALTRGLSAVFLSSVVGQYIDRGNRLRVVRISIVLQRLVVAASCVVFYLLAKVLAPTPGVKITLLVLLAFLACIEKLCAIMNLVSVERDWVVVIAEKDPTTLLHINAQMRRIDLACKLAGPLFIALIDGITTEAAILVNFAMNVASVPAEYSCIAKVFREVPSLQQPKTASQNRPDGGTLASPSEYPFGVVSRISNTICTSTRQTMRDFELYFHHPAFLPSFAGALLYFTVLSFSGQMVTYLLSADFTSTQIGIARTIAVAFELLATWIAPWLMELIGTLRAGLWLSGAQVISLAAGIAIFVAYSRQPGISAAGLVGGTILSRVGLRGFDLCVQIIVQEEVEAEIRGAFSSVEAAWQNVFELCSYVSTIVFSRPDEFDRPALTSVAAVAGAWTLYTVFVYLRRGHLLHLPSCVPSEKRRRERESRERLIWEDVALRSAL